MLILWFSSLPSCPKQSQNYSIWVDNIVNLTTNAWISHLTPTNWIHLQLTCFSLESSCFNLHPAFSCTEYFLVVAQLITAHFHVSFLILSFFPCNKAQDTFHLVFYVLQPYFSDGSCSLVPHTCILIVGCVTFILLWWMRYLEQHDENCQSQFWSSQRKVWQSYDMFRT